MKCWFQVVTTPTADTAGTTVILHFDGKRYLIGSLAEGTQRACMQTGARLMKVNECFLTGRTEWKNTGGVIGMLLTVADAISSSEKSTAHNQASKPNAKPPKPKASRTNGQQASDVPSTSLNIFAPPNLNYQLATARKYVFRKGMPINITEIDYNTSPTTEPFWQDENIKVWAMPVMPATRPNNPRKRSYEMIDDQPSVPEEQALGRDIIVDDISVEMKNKALVKHVVGQMFNSTWRLDTLHETRLADVQLPASIFIRNEETNKIEKYYGPKPGQHLPDPDLQVLVRKPWPGALVDSLPPAKPAKEALSYIFKTHTQRGRFLPAKAKELKVKAGPNFAKLVAGQSVVNEEGATITPDQVMEPNRPGNGFAVVELPDVSYVEGLLARPEWQDETVFSGVQSIIWSCGPGVIRNEKLKAFIESLPDVKHILSDAEHSGNYPAFASSTIATQRLAKIDAKRHHNPIYDETTKEPSFDNFKLLTALPGLQMVIEPEMVPDLTGVRSKVDAISEAPLEVREKAAEGLQAMQAGVQELSEWAKTIPGKDVEITTLGTGSASPSKYRNVSATLLRVPGWGSMLFDAGENTMGQIRRAYPPNEVKEIMSQLRIICISHMHADHHLGMVSVIKEWYREAHNLMPPSAPLPEGMQERFEQQRLTVLAEPSMLDWLREYAQIEDFGYARIAPVLLSVGNRERGSELTWDRQGGKVTPEMVGLKDVQAVAVQHCLGARAVSLTWADGFKASYSGDCRPSREFSRIGKDSTVCIHEATFDDELRGDAQAKNHSTTSEALRVAQNMHAKTCILTHFSQRYQKVPVLERSEERSVEPPAFGAESTGAASKDYVFDQDNDGINDEPVDAPAVETMADPAEIVEQQQADGGAAQTVTYNPDFVAVEPNKSVFTFKLTSDMKVGIAFDYMRVKVGEIGEMQHFTPALIELFAQEEEVQEGAEAVQSFGVAGSKGQRRN